MPGLQSKGKYFLSCLFLVMFFLMFSGFATAVEDTHPTGGETVEQASEHSGGEAGHAADRKGDLLDLLWRFVNFALLVIILFIVIKRSPLKGFFAARRDEIRRKLEDLKREKEEAENRYKEIERQLKDFESKRSEIIDQFKKEGLAEKEKIIAEAKERVRQILEQSELTIQQEIESARDRLKSDVVELAAKKAQEIISKEINEGDEDKLINDFIERVGKIH